jgi:hypothetical protein
MKRSLAAIVVVLMAAGCASLGATGPGNAENPASISWKGVRQESDSTYIKGSLRAPFGLFILTWRVDAWGNAALADEEPSGTGEMPIYDKTPLYPWLPGDGKAYIFRIRMPVLGDRNPVSLRLVAVAKEDELFAGLAKVLAERSDRKYPRGLAPSGSKSPLEVTAWNSSDLSWRMSEKGQMRLYALGPSGEPVETLPWMMESTPNASLESLVFEVRAFRVEDISLEFLNCRIKVNTAQMLSAR